MKLLPTSIRNFGSLKKLSMAIACVFSVALLGASYVAQTDKAVTEVANAFGVNDATLVAIQFEKLDSQQMPIPVQIGGQQYVMELEPYSIRTKGFIFQVQLPDGTYENRQPEPSKTVRGSLRAEPGSRVVGSVLDSGLSVKIVMADGTVYFVEPLGKQVDVPNPENMHVLYRKADVKDHGCQCGVDHAALGQLKRENNIVDNLDQDIVDLKEPRRESGNVFARGGGGGFSIAELAVDADFEFFSDYGTEQNTLDRMENIISIVNDQYEQDVNITHMISGAIVRTSEPDPFSSTDAFTLLSQFRSHWLNNQQGIQRDVAHLFTGKEINGGTIGIAWDIGAICNTSAYCLSQADFNGSNGCATDLVAHELGHLWNGSHCNCQSHTMNAFITCANDFNPANTIPSITSYRDTLDCLDGGGGGGPNPPANDNWDDTVRITELNFSLMGTNEAATTQAGEQQLDNTGSTVWWFFEPTENGTMTVDTFGSDFDTQLHIYTGFPTEFENLIPVVNNDDSGGVLQSEVAFAVTAGECYEIRVGGWRQTGQTGDGAEGNISLNGAFVPDMPFVLGDVDCNGVVNLLDVGPFIDLLSDGGFSAKADINGDGFVNLLDVDGFITILSGG